MYRLPLLVPTLGSAEIAFFDFTEFLPFTGWIFEPEGRWGDPSLLFSSSSRLLLALLGPRLILFTSAVDTHQSKMQDSITTACTYQCGLEPEHENPLSSSGPSARQLHVDSVHGISCYYEYAKAHCQIHQTSQRHSQRFWTPVPHHLVSHSNE